MGCGIAAGITGSFYGPVLPVGYTALVGVPKVRIRHSTVSDVRYLDSDAYILGYEREARGKRRIYALIGTGIGLFLGYGTYFAWLQHEPGWIFSNNSKR
jgi:hypothetical protein